MDFTKKVLIVFALIIMLLGIYSIHCRQSFKPMMPWFGEGRYQCFDTKPCLQGMVKCIEFCSSMGTANGQCNNENLCCCIY
ncbi:hypothetical protein EUTSA_v10015998mg [Eutrema salsugineum]|uniref:Uncharacterized protein n=1 Tax=Eutrema salsugineum TaxID=72664 RepID=V4LEG1_EUTSA|nr:defensin-like protein 109 [Eutrema salsugineum]ESQ40802.1 hypothetical protein EUTSA_v10015998mg [Eutrema salsugineum]